MREERPEKGQWIAPRLAREVFATLDRGEQALLFLNRRGYAPLTLCKACGHQYQCPDCSAWLVEHRFRGVLMCHHCGHTQKMPKACAQCGAEDALVAVGPGIERVAEEAVARFPEARTVILSSDMGSNAQLRDRFSEIERRSIYGRTLGLAQGAAAALEAIDMGEHEGVHPAIGALDVLFAEMAEHPGREAHRAPQTLDQRRLEAGLGRHRGELVRAAAGRKELVHVPERQPPVLPRLLDLLERVALLAQPGDDPGVRGGGPGPAAAVVGDHAGLAPAPQRAGRDAGLAGGFDQRYLSRSGHGSGRY